MTGCCAAEEVLPRKRCVAPLPVSKVESENTREHGAVAGRVVVC